MKVEEVEEGWEHSHWALNVGFGCLGSDTLILFVFLLMVSHFPPFLFSPTLLPQWMVSPIWRLRIIGQAQGCQSSWKMSFKSLLLGLPGRGTCNGLHPVSVQCVSTAQWPVAWQLSICEHLTLSRIHLLSLEGIWLVSESTAGLPWGFCCYQYIYFPASPLFPWDPSTPWNHPHKQRQSWRYVSAYTIDPGICSDLGYHGYSVKERFWKKFVPGLEKCSVGVLGSWSSLWHVLFAGLVYIQERKIK